MAKRRRKRRLFDDQMHAALYYARKVRRELAILDRANQGEPLEDDFVPEQFAFTDLTGAVKNTVYESDPITLDGTTPGEDIPLTISNGEYAVAEIEDGTGVFGAWSSAARNVQDGDIIKLRKTSSNTELTAVAVVLTIGGVSATWTITTQADAVPADVTPDAFAFVDVSDVAAGSVNESNEITVLGTTTAAPLPVTITGGEYSKNGGAWTSAAGTAVLGDLIKVRGTAVAAEDPDILNLVFLSGFEGAHGSTTVTDEAAGRTVTMTGTTAQIRTSKFKFGTSSYFNGTDGKLAVTHHADLNLGSSDFTLAGWFAFATPNQSSNLFSKDGASRGFRFRYSQSSDKLILEISADGVAMTTVAQESGTWNPTSNTWYYLAATFDGTTYRIFRDGVLVGSGTVLVTMFANTHDLCIGGDSAGNNDFNGWIDEAAFWKVCKYAAAFTAPAAPHARAGATGIVDVALTVSGVSDTFRITTIAAPSSLDDTPDAFAFDALEDVGFEQTYESPNTITVAGINTTAAISIVDGEYSKNGGAYTSVAGTVVVGDTVRVRAISSGSNSVTTTATLTIGGVSADFEITTAAIGSTAQSVILDGDIGGDVDDAVCMALMCKEHVEGRINLLAYVASTDSDPDAGCARAFLDFYGCEDVPVYAHQGSILGTFPDNYSSAVRDRFGTVGLSRTTFTSDVTGLRTLLSQVPDNSVKYITVGGHTSAWMLRNSSADGISPLTGDQLVAAKISTLYVMGGSNLNPETGGVDYNCSRDIPASQDIAANWPTPVVWHGSEIGNSVMSGPAQGLSEYHDPCKHAFVAYESAGNLTDGKRDSWDPLTALYAVSAANRATYTLHRTNATVSVSATGVVTSTATAGNDSIVATARTDAEVGAELNALLDVATNAPTRTNLIPRSNGFMESPWVTNANVTLTAGHPDPFGGNDAYLLSETTTTASHAHGAALGWFVNATTYAIELYVKMGTRRYVQLSVGSTGFSGTTRYANFDLQLGVLGTRGATAISSWIVPVPNQAGWYRIGVTIAASSTTFGGSAFVASIPASNSTRAASFTGSASNNFYIYGMQMAASTVSVPYVSTMPATVDPPDTTIDVLAGPTQPLFDPTSWPYWDISSPNVPLHTNSANYTTEFIAQMNNFYGHVGINYAQYTAPIYVVGDDVEEQYVAHRNTSGTYAYLPKPDMQAALVAVPIPDYAQRSVGTDRQMLIYRPSTNECWELFNLKDQTADPAELTEPPYDLPILDPDGNVVKWVARWGGHFENMNTSIPQWPKPPGHGQMASGIPVLAGIPLVHEIQTALATPGYGSLPHSIKFALGPWCAHWSLFSWPANRSDGSRPATEPNRIRYGQRFRLDPTLDLDDYPNLHPLAKVIFRTLQKHGGHTADRGGLITMAFENRQRWTAMGEPDPYLPIFNGTPSYDVMDGFPWTSLQWLPFDFGKPGTQYAGNTGY
jgi:hypothetical protein